MTPPTERSAAIEHFVSTQPFDPYAVEKLTAEQERYFLASQWRLMWWKLKRHRLAVASGVFLLLMYLSAIFSEFIAPYNLHTRQTEYLYAPPQPIHLFHEGEFIGPFVYGLERYRDMELLKWDYRVNRSKVLPIRFLCMGDGYEFWGMVPGRFHLACPAKGGTLFLFGTDRLGRDMLSRILYGARISLTIGLIGISISFLLGISIGGLAGYYGGWVDNVSQRTIEVLRSFPALPL